LLAYNYLFHFSFHIFLSPVAYIFYVFSFLNPGQL